MVTDTTIAQLAGRMLGNLRLYTEAQKVGFEYLLNPDTGELHRVASDAFWGSHNLSLSDLHNFIGLVNVGLIPATSYTDGRQLPVYDLETGMVIGSYALNKCKHCFPSSKFE